MEKISFDIELFEGYTCQGCAMIENQIDINEADQSYICFIPEELDSEDAK